MTATKIAMGIVGGFVLIVAVLAVFFVTYLILLAKVDMMPRDVVPANVLYVAWALEAFALGAVAMLGLWLANR